jgi:hypothetical protein
MNIHGNKNIWTIFLLVVSAVFIIVSVPGTAQCNPVPKVDADSIKGGAPSAEGFIQQWLILDPIPASGDTQGAVQTAVKTEHFANELTMLPKKGDKVDAGGRQLTWHAVATDEYNVNLYYFASEVGTNCNNSLFWVVIYINCPEEVKDARLAIGSNSASVWWLNGKEVIGIYGNRMAVIDDGVTKRMTLKKGLNVIRGGVVNASGAADFCARILDSEGKPFKGYTVSLNPSGN